MTDTKLKDYIDELNETKFKLRNKIDISTKYTFGIEIEFENTELNNIKYGKKWDVKEDDTTTIKIDGASIGGEVSSPILRDTEKCWKDVEHICNYLKNKGALVTPKTGGHIHIGSQILKDDPNNIRKLLKQWELFEHIIYTFSSGRDKQLRSGSKIQAKKISSKLKRIRTSKNSYNKYQTYFDWYNFFKSFQLSRFEGLNFKNYKGNEEDLKNTIEVRCPNGTIDPIIWQNNINFFIKFFEYCSSDNFDEEYIDYLLDNKSLVEYGDVYTIMDIDSAVELVDLIFENRLDKIMFLKQYLKIFEKGKQYIKK